MKIASIPIPIPVKNYTALSTTPIINPVTSKIEKLELLWLHFHSNVMETNTLPFQQRDLKYKFENKLSFQLQYPKYTSHPFSSSRHKIENTLQYQLRDPKTHKPRTKALSYMHVQQPNEAPD